MFSLYAVGMLKLSVIRSREVSAIQGFLMYSINIVSIRTSAIVCYRAGVRNSEVSTKKGSTAVGRKEEGGWGVGGRRNRGKKGGREGG